MIKQFTFNHFEVNTYIVIDEATRQCAIVDPACEASFEDAQLTQYIEQEQLQVTHILLTHAHVDHLAGLRQCCEHYRLPVTMHAEGRHLLKQAEVYGSLMGFAVDNMGDLEVVEIEDNQVLCIGNTPSPLRGTPPILGGEPKNVPLSTDTHLSSPPDAGGVSEGGGGICIECRYVPGHCPGSICFVVPTDKVVITGDALFHFSIGRTDLPGGDYPTLIEKLKTRILTLPDEYAVLPGHGIASQIGKERKYNSFLN